MNLKLGFSSLAASRIDQFAECFVKYRLKNRDLTWLVAMVLLALQAGCGGSQKPVAQPAQPSAEQLASEHRAVLEKKRRAREASIKALLTQAEAALAKNQLTTPADNNALDRYRAVALLAPGDARAKEGIKKVAQRYCQLAYGALSSGRLNQAATWLDKAEQIEPTLVAIAPLQAQLNRARKQAKAVPKLQEPVALSPDNDVVDLPADQLKDRSDTLVTALQDLAQKVKQDDSYVLIVARSDADGRWVYQQMKQALPGYRLRGNIELGREPKIVLQAPL